VVGDCQKSVHDVEVGDVVAGFAFRRSLGLASFARTCRFAVG
jgi:hypothetical protein